MKNKFLNCALRFVGKFKLYEIFTYIGLEGLAYRIFFHDEVVKSRNYFFGGGKVQDRINKVCDSLADKKSVEIYKKSIAYRIDRYRHNHPQWDSKDQYFPRDIIKISNQEVFIDCGAYTGDTMEIFINLIDIKNWKGKYIGFEPNDCNYNQLIKKSGKQFIFYKYGVWKESGVLKFYNGDMVNVVRHEKVSEKDIVNVEVIAIDKVDECKEASFIKMDIEGSEMEALLGAENIIRSNRPKLAICIYHSDEDMIRIAEWIISLKLNYKLYIRHHSLYHVETVLYAVPC